MRIIAGENGTKTTGREFSEKEIQWAWQNAKLVFSKHGESLRSFQAQIDRGAGSVQLADAMGSLLTATIPRTGRIRAGCKFTDFCNNAFQGLVSDIAKLAWYDLHKSGYGVVHIVHDEVVSEVKEGSEDHNHKMKLIQEEILTGAARLLCPNVKMNVESHFAKYWGK